MRAEIRTALLDVVARRPGGSTTTQICDALGTSAPVPLVLDSYLRELVRDGAVERKGSVFNLNGHAAAAAPAAPARPAATHPESTSVDVKKKLCQYCKVAKPLDEFHKHARGALGVDPLCKACKSRRAKEYYERRKQGAPSPDAKPKAQPRAPAGGLTVEVERTYTLRIEGLEPIRLSAAQLDELTAWWKQARAER